METLYLLKKKEKRKSKELFTQYGWRQHEIQASYTSQHNSVLHRKQAQRVDVPCIGIQL